MEYLEPVICLLEDFGLLVCHAAWIVVFYASGKNIGPTFKGQAVTAPLGRWRYDQSLVSKSLCPTRNLRRAILQKSEGLNHTAADSWNVKSCLLVCCLKIRQLNTKLYNCVYCFEGTSTKSRSGTEPGTTRFKKNDYPLSGIAVW
jgi:hypothetical protein